MAAVGGRRASGGGVHRVLVVPQRGGPVVPRILHLGKAKELERADVSPTDVELEPLRLELRALGIGVVVVVKLLAAKPDRDGRDVPALVLDLEVPIAEGVADAVDDASGPERDPDHLDAPDGGTD